MSDKYNEYCMKFSNKELQNMIKYLIENSWNKNLIRFLSEDGHEIGETLSDRVETIVFDGEDENLFINFYGIHTSIFVYDEELMFIDDKSRELYTSSDVYDNVVYEGKLREMSHEQMLQMFADIVLCFADAIGVSVTQSDVPENTYKRYSYYEPHMFVVNVENEHSNRKTKVFENLTIIY